MKSCVVATGSYLPSKILTNDDLAKTVKTSDSWIFERTGIKKRHIASDDQKTSDLAVQAALGAIQSSKISLQEIDAIIVATTTPDLTFPSTATIVQAKLGIKNCFAFDVQAVCSGFIYALNIADNFIKVGQVRTALVIGAETLSRIVDWSDRNTCVLFGDGAGALILQASDHPSRGIIASKLSSDGSLVDILKTTGGVSSSQNAGFIEMQGKEVFKHAVEKMSSCVFECLEIAGLAISDVDLLIPHQANARILTSVAARLGIAKEKVIINIENHANTSAASIPLALDYANKNKVIKDGNLVVLEALGGGLVWGSVILRW
jgi:3-oxoacyl-[acyl-carrier-protein] synthase-3